MSYFLILKTFLRFWYTEWWNYNQSVPLFLCNVPWLEAVRQKNRRLQKKLGASSLSLVFDQVLPDFSGGYFALPNKWAIYINPKVHRVLGFCGFQWCGFHLCIFSKNSPNIQLMRFPLHKWRNSFTHAFLVTNDLSAGFCGFLSDLKNARAKDRV